MADLMRKTFGDRGAQFISLLILLAALSTINAAIITGARTNYALGRDYPLLKFLGSWQGSRNTPVNALLAQGAIALLLVVLGTQSRDGFVMMVEYTAPVFWFFLLMVGVSILILRYKNPQIRRPFIVPLYPFLPFLFCVICIFMLYSSIMYTSSGSLVGVGVLLTGIPVIILQKTKAINR
jgi:amino acid transporter